MEVQHTVPPVSALSRNPEAAFNDLGERIAGALAAVSVGATSALGQSTRHPTFSAYKEYVAGSDLFTQGRWDEAIAHYTRAYELDSTFVEALLIASTAHNNAGRLADTDSLLRIVAQSVDQLSGRGRLGLAWSQADLQGNRLEALRASRELSQQSPVWRYQYAYDARSVNRPQEAVNVLEQTDPTEGSMKKWLPFWGELTTARHMLGDHRRELRDARRGREQHPDRLEAFRYEARALAALGRVDEVRVLLDELLSLQPDPSWGHAYPAAIAGLEFRAHGHHDAAQEVLELALDRLRTHLPDDDQRRTHQYNVGRIFYWSERFEEAGEVFLQLVAEGSNSVDYLGYLGVVHARLGNVEEASRISDELAALDRPYLWGANTEWQAAIGAVLGNREQPVELLRRAFNEGLEYSIWLHRAPAFESLRDYPPFQILCKPKG
jgi:tetratricopeptide (TPR) repeat protein